MLRLVSRATIYSLAKVREGWSKEELARAQSAEALTLVADNYQIGLHAAQQRLGRLLSEGEAVPDEAQAASGSDLAPLRARQRHEVGLATMEQSARRGLAAEVSPPGPFMRRLSEVAMRRRDLPLAIDWARKAVDADSKDPWSQHQLSGLLLSAGDAEGATAAAEAALATTTGKPHPALLRRMAELEVWRKDRGAAVAWSRKAVEADVTDGWSHFGLSGALLTAELLDEAEREVRLAIDHSPQPAPSPFYSRLGEIYQRRGERATALEWIKRAVEIDPNDRWAQFSLSGLLMAFGKIDEAATAARQAVMVGGRNVPPAMARRLSEVELARRNVPEAVEWAQQAVASDPSDGWSQHQLSTVLQRSGDVAGAATAAEAAVAAAGGAVPSEFYRRLSEVRREQGQMNEAVALAHQAVQAAPESPWSSLHLARLLLSTRDLDGAMASAKQAIGAAQGIKNGIFSRSLSEIYVARNELERALAWARKAVVIDETDEWSHSHLASVLLSLGDIDGAERAARLALIHSSPSAVEYFSGIVRKVESRRAAPSAA
jgi:tetratricopeptide (TPR) repeat protein